MKACAEQSIAVNCQQKLATPPMLTVLHDGSRFAPPIMEDVRAGERRQRIETDQRIRIKPDTKQESKKWHGTNQGGNQKKIFPPARLAPPTTENTALTATSELASPARTLGAMSG